MSANQPVPDLSVVLLALEDLGIWTDILPDVNPSHIAGVLEMRYPSGISVYAGVTPHHDQVQELPTIHFHGNLDSSAQYILIMTDPDLMKTNDPIDKQVRHWVQPRLTVSSGSKQLTSTRDAHTSFLPSAPMPMTGPHRYVFILAKQRREVGIGERNGNADFKERLGFVAQDFITEHNLEVVGVSAMKVAPTASAGVEDAKLMAESAKHLVVN